MSSSSMVLSNEDGSVNQKNAFPAEASLSNHRESHLEHEGEEKALDEDEEEEDIDFDPFLKESPFTEASSSLSSETEVLGADGVESKGKTTIGFSTNLSSASSGQVQDYALGDSEHGEEIVMQTDISSGRAGSSRFKKRKAVLISEPENDTHNKKDDHGSGAEINEVMVGDINRPRKHVIDMDHEDAICKRTRARYSLASFTLDELESFLQETDDDDDLPNVDDEEEYRKFLAAVLQGGDNDSQTIQGTETVDEDEDEDNDADFEIEIEEALESDFDENPKDETKKKHEAGSRRPETRLNRRQKASSRQKDRLLGQSNRPLRPLLPNAPVASFSALISDTAPHCVSFSGHDGFANGFTPHQLGQLHCLIHEHIQLLVQVFSLCVIEPSRQHIASQVQELISEMLRQREQVISWKRVPHPHFCFSPPYIHPSAEHRLSNSLTAPCPSESACCSEKRRDSFSGTNKGPLLDAVSSTREKCGTFSNGQEGQLQTSNSVVWVPFVNDPILSVLDVAPLKLVGKFMDDVSTAVREHQQQRLKAACDTSLKKEPLFPFHSCQSFSEVNPELVRDTSLPTVKIAPHTSTGELPLKKTLAAALVERTKKQSIALVPKEIAQLAQRFLPLFNPALFPHKPPPAPVANRVLFTEAEDELLAMGLMEYNTDWKAIQHRFLPCKSKHQIFVRQKNRSSSKAPDNPIKAVRRMKSSPLTAEETARIQEGLKVFKLDWMSVWKFVVPYRDPSLLPRQWRIATGTQKSYKSSADKKEKRRLYESNRRKCRPTVLPSWQTSLGREDCQTDIAGGENNSGDDYMENEDEAYVHEAFLADWRPDTSFNISSRLSASNLRERNQPSDLLSQGGSCAIEQTNNSVSVESQPQISHEFSAVFNHSQNLSTFSHYNHARLPISPLEPNQPNSNMPLRPSISQFSSRPYRSRRLNNAQLVKLAPDLPPVNLPPSVRVMSQSAFKSYQGGVSTKVPAPDACIRSAATENTVSPHPRASNSVSNHPTKSAENIRNPLEKSNRNQHRQKPFLAGEKCVAGDKDESDLKMHPLLFQSSGDGPLSYYPLDCGSSISSSFNFLPQIHPQLNLSLLYNPQQTNEPVHCFDKSSKEITSSAGGIDFHPLLQKADGVTCDSVTAQSFPHLSANLDLSRASPVQPLNPSCTFQSESQVNRRPLPHRSKSSSPEGKANDLDLEIHLSFTSKKEKGKGNKDVTEHIRTTSNSNDMVSGTTKKAQGMNNSSDQHSGCFPVASILPNRISNKLNSGSHALVVSIDTISMHGVNIEGDQSLPEIVMEQEELSDSEDELGEHVEFEREEMDDSEADEGSDSEQIMDIQNKEITDAARDKAVKKSEFGARQARSKGCLPSSRTEANAMYSTATVDSGHKSYSSSRPNRSHKKPLSLGKHVAEESGSSVAKPS